MGVGCGFTDPVLVEKRQGVGRLAVDVESGRRLNVVGVRAVVLVEEADPVGDELGQLGGARGAELGAVDG